MSECKKCKKCKRQCFCEQNSKICAVSRVSPVMEQLRGVDLDCCKGAYVAANLPTSCVSPPCSNRT